MDMDDWEMQNVIGRPDFHKGNLDKGYWPVGRSALAGQETREVGPKELWFQTRGKAMETLGFSQEEIDKEWQEYKKKLTFAC